MTTEDFSRLSVEQRLANLPDTAIVDMHPVARGRFLSWRARIAWPSDLPREHTAMAFTHATRSSNTEALQTCAGRVRERCLQNPEAWGITPLELGRLLLYWEFRASDRGSDGRDELDGARDVLDDLVCVLETAPRVCTEMEDVCPGLVRRLRAAAQQRA